MIRCLFILCIVAHSTFVNAKFYVDGTIGSYHSHWIFSETITGANVPKHYSHTTNKKQFMYGATAGYILPIDGFFLAPEISIMLPDSSVTHTHTYTDGRGPTSKTIKFNHMCLVNVGARFGFILDHTHLFFYLGGVHTSGKWGVTRPGHNINYGKNIKYWSFSSGVGASYLLNNDYYVRIDYRYIANKKIEQKQVSQSQRYTFKRKANRYNQMVYFSFGTTF